MPRDLDLAALPDNPAAICNGWPIGIAANNGGWIVAGLRVTEPYAPLSILVPHRFHYDVSLAACSPHDDSLVSRMARHNGFRYHHFGMFRDDRFRRLRIYYRDDTPATWISSDIRQWRMVGLLAAEDTDEIISRRFDRE